MIPGTDHKKTILIAEDEKINYFLLQTMLKKMDYEIIWARNGLEAITICMDHPEIDLILMDIKMPVMDGIEASLKIKSIRENLPIIAQTAYDLTPEKKLLFQGYIKKPIMKRELSHQLEHCI